MQQHLEDLLLEHRVDLGLYGHHHSYQRTCQVYRNQCLAPSGDAFYHAPVHAVVGMAGQGLSQNGTEKERVGGSADECSTRTEENGWMNGWMTRHSFTRNKLILTLLHTLTQRSHSSRQFGRRWTQIILA